MWKNADVADLHPSLVERGASPLLLFAPLPHPRPWWSGLRFCFSLLCVLALANVGFGQLDGGWTLHGEHVGLLAGLLLVWGLSSIFEDVSVWKRRRAVDWPAGLYLFEAGLVDGCSPELPRLPISKVESIRVVRQDPSSSAGFGGLELSFPGKQRLVLPVREGDAAERLGRRIQQLAGEDPAWGDEADTESEGESPAPPVRLLRPLLPRLVATLVALILGLLAWELRDRLSDDLALEQALSSEGSAGLRRYLIEVGGRHTGPVIAGELPQRAFHETVGAKKMAALLDWRAEFSGPRTEETFEEAHANMYREAREVLALRDALGGPLEEERRQSLRTLLDLQESAGSPPVSLRFEEEASRWLENLDEVLEGHHDGRPVARAGRHVRGIPEERRQRQLAEALEEGLQLLLGSRIIYFSETAEELSENKPGAWVRGLVEPGTSVFEVEGRKEVFVELLLGLRLELTVPGAAPVSLDLFLETPDVFVAPDRPEREESASSQVYEAMLRRVMDGLSEAFVKSFGGPGGAITPVSSKDPIRASSEQGAD